MKNLTFSDIFVTYPKRKSKKYHLRESERKGCRGEIHRARAAQQAAQIAIIQAFEGGGRNEFRPYNEGVGRFFMVRMSRCDCCRVWLWARG
jgi:hypothetical protein